MIVRPQAEGRAVRVLQKSNIRLKGEKSHDLGLPSSGQEVREASE